MRNAIFTGLTGLSLGFFLSNIGFSSWDEVHAMFTFSSFRMFSAFCFAAVILMISWKIIAHRTGASWNPRRIHPGTIVGGLFFGIGWAISGACPSIALVQIGEGQLGALVTLAGMFMGNWLYTLAHERYFNWSSNSCSDD